MSESTLSEDKLTSNLWVSLQVDEMMLRGSCSRVVPLPLRRLRAVDTGVWNGHSDHGPNVEDDSENGEGDDDACDGGAD